MPKIRGYVEKEHSEKGLRTEHGDFQGIESSAFQVRQYLRHAPAQDLVSCPAYQSRFLSAAQLQKPPIGPSHFLTKRVIVEISNHSPTGEKRRAFHG